MIIARLHRDPAFAAALLGEAVACLLAGDLAVGKDLLRDCVNGTLGFEKLSKAVKVPAKSLMRMLGAKGNPQMANLFAIIRALQDHAGIELRVAAE